MNVVCPACSQCVPAGAIVFDEVGQTIRNQEFVERLTRAEAIIYGVLLSSRQRVTWQRIKEALAAGLERPLSNGNAPTVLISRLREKIALFDIRIESHPGGRPPGYRLVLPAASIAQAV